MDSRAYPTVEVDVKLEDGSLGRAIVPSGASTGKFEAVELRDNDPNYYNGKGVKCAIENINTLINNLLVGKDSYNQNDIDHSMIKLDGTSNKRNLGANAILGVSIANAKATAHSKGIPLYDSLALSGKRTLPIPMMNILNGGCHADNNLDIQEYMIFPVGANSFSEALQMGTETFYYLKDILKNKNLTTTVGDEGGFAPNLRSNDEAIELILEAVEKTPYKLEKDLFIALDIAASELYNGKYNLISEKKQVIIDICHKHHILEPDIDNDCKDIFIEMFEFYQKLAKIRTYAAWLTTRIDTPNSEIFKMLRTGLSLPKSSSYKS